MKRNKILLGTFMLSLFFSLNLSAQNYNKNHRNHNDHYDRYENRNGDRHRDRNDRHRNNRYDYDDTVIIISDNYYDRGNNRRHKHYRRDNDRRWKSKIMDRAIRIAEADGRVTRREMKELRALENELGIRIRDNRYCR